MFQAMITVRPLTLVVGKISYEDKGWIETLRNGNLVLDTEQITIVAQLPEKGWTLLSESNL